MFPIFHDSRQYCSKFSCTCLLVKCARISVTAGLKLLFKIAIPIYIPTGNVQEFLLLHILATLGFVTLANFLPIKWTHNCVLPWI